MKDPYDYIEWKPYCNHQVTGALRCQEEKRQRRQYTSRPKDQLITYAYDLIALFTLATFLATLFKLLLH